MRTLDESFEEEEETSPLTGPRLVTAALTLLLCGLIVHNTFNGQMPRQAAVDTETIAVEAPPKPAGPETESPDPSRLATRMKVDVPPQDQAAPEAVRAIQSSLAALGHYRGPIDGVERPDLRNAILTVEREMGFEESGRPSVALAERLRLAQEIAAIAGEAAMPSEGLQPREVETGTAGLDIGAVQRALARLGYSTGPADGSLGPRTRDAIRQFERDRRLAQTGEITPALLSEIARLGAGG